MLNATSTSKVGYRQRSGDASKAEVMGETDLAGSACGRSSP
jgi:hypothetical protein